ncbi:MAG TPA: hypothetical protein VIX41_07625 [Acidimicrobiales bacterium]
MAFGGKQAPPFTKKTSTKGKSARRKPGKSAPAQKALRLGGSLRGGGRY